MSHQKPLYAKTIGKPNSTKVIWHKRNLTEELLTALDASIRGVSGVEFDVVSTKDNVPVLFHDKTLSDGTEVSSLTLDNLEERGESINTLEDALGELSNRRLPNNFEFHLEVKPPEAKFWHDIKEVLEKFPQIDSQTIPRSFHEDVIQEIKTDNPDRKSCLLMCKPFYDASNKYFAISERTSPDTLPDSKSLRELCGGHTLEHISVEYDMLTQEFVDDMQRNKINVDVYTLNEYSDLKGFKVGSIVTDKPSAILSALEEERSAQYTIPVSRL